MVPEQPLDVPPGKNAPPREAIFPPTDAQPALVAAATDLHPVPRSSQPSRCEPVEREPMHDDSPTRRGSAAQATTLATSVPTNDSATATGKLTARRCRGGRGCGCPATPGPPGDRRIAERANKAMKASNGMGKSRIGSTHRAEAAQHPPELEAEGQPGHRYDPATGRCRRRR